MSRAMSGVVLAAAIVCWTSLGSLAQQSTNSETKAFEVLAVEGNQLVVKLPEGTKELTVADDFRFNFNGQQLSVHQLKPGMKGTATITTRTTVTPVTVTEVKNGTVMQSAGTTIYVRTDEGVKAFSQGDVDKRGVQIMLNGRPAKLSDFHQGDQLSATIITSKPPRIVTEKEVQGTLAPVATTGIAPPPAAPPAAAPVPRAVVEEPAAQAPTATAARALPETASTWPLLGFAALLSLAAGLTLTVTRRFAR